MNLLNLDMTDSLDEDFPTWGNIQLDLEKHQVLLDELNETYGTEKTELYLNYYNAILPGELDLPYLHKEEIINTSNFKEIEVALSSNSLQEYSCLVSTA